MENENNEFEDEPESIYWGSQPSVNWFNGSLYDGSFEDSEY